MDFVNKQSLNRLFLIAFLVYSHFFPVSLVKGSGVSFEDFCDIEGVETNNLYLAAQYGFVLEESFGKMHQVGRFAGGVARVTHTRGNGSDMNLYIGQNWSQSSLALTINSQDTNEASIILNENNIFYLGGASYTGYPQWSNMVFRVYDSGLNKTFEQTFFDDGYVWDASIDSIGSSVLAAYRNGHSYYAALYDAATNSMGTTQVVLDDLDYGTIKEPISCLLSVREALVAFYDYTLAGQSVLAAAVYDFENQESILHTIDTSQGNHGIDSIDISTNRQISAAIWDFEDNDKTGLLIAAFDATGEVINTFEISADSANYPKIFVTQDSRILIAYSQTKPTIALYNTAGQLLWESNFYDTSSVFSNGMITDGGRHGFDYDYVDDVIYYNYVSQIGPSFVQRAIPLEVDGDNVSLSGSLGSPVILSDFIDLDFVAGDQATIVADAVGEQIIIDTSRIQVLPRFIDSGEPLARTQSFLRYEWYKDGLLIEGEDGDELNFEPIQLGDAGEYYYKAINHLGSMTSQSATVSVQPPPDIDADGLPDNVETNTGIWIDFSDTGTDPSNPDTDGDGLNDGDEVNLHNSNPLDVDSDNDTITDGIEVRHQSYGFDPAVDSTAELAAFRGAAAELPTVMTEEQAGKMSLGGVALNPNGSSSLSMDFVVETSDDLEEWDEVDTLTYPVDTAHGKIFMRVRKP